MSYEEEDTIPPVELAFAYRPHVGHLQTSHAPGHGTDKGPSSLV